MSLACGIDVGGTKIAGGVVDERGRVLERLRVDSPATDGEAMEDAIASLVRELASRHAISAVGIGAPGYVDAGRSTVMFTPNLPWRDLDLKSELERRVDLPVVVENDANCAAWGEFAFGAGEDVDDLLLLTVGTGVGGGLVLDGRLYRGAFGIAAEMGHLRVVPGGELCGCGNRGCLEQYASGSALVREAREQVRAGSPLTHGLLERAGGDVEAITGPLVTEAAQAGDSFAVEMLADVGRWLGEATASLASVVDPAVIAIGGGVSEAGDLLLGPTRAAFATQLSGRGHRPVAELRLASLGNEAGLIGAADLARLFEEARMPLFIGVDIGGTKVLATAVSSSGRVLRTARRTTPGRRVEARLVEDALTGAVEEIARGRRVGAIGIAAAGFVDAQGERVRFAPHLPWRDEGVRGRLAERWSAPVVLDNDANCAARAELIHGAVGDADDALVVTLGTGIGGAVVLDGAVHRGYNGMAGEFGHMQVVPGGAPCECGLSGCWEQYCSGNALVRHARAHLLDGPTSLTEACGGDPEALTGPMVTAAAAAGDAVALAAFASVGEWLGVGLAGLVAAFDPEIVVVGGGLSAAEDLLLEPARASLRTALVGGAHRTVPPVVRAALGPEAGAIGAADLARQTFRSAGSRARARARAARGRAPRR